MKKIDQKKKLSSVLVALAKFLRRVLGSATTRVVLGFTLRAQIINPP